MKPTKTSVHHYFHIERDPNWPDLPWPSWKFETKKMFRPMTMSFKIHVEDGKLDVSNPILSGPRILSSGALGVDVSENYFTTEKRCPPFILALIDEAKRCIVSADEPKPTVEIDEAFARLKLVEERYRAEFPGGRLG